LARKEQKPIWQPNKRLSWQPQESSRNSIILWAGRRRQRKKRARTKKRVVLPHSSPRGPSAEKDPTKKDVSNVEEPVSNAEGQEAATQPEENSDDEIPKKAKRARKGRAKPTSYLDELLAERTKKKNKKNQA
jgi:hypothetical protein